jgi:hypothetical protein
MALRKRGSITDAVTHEEIQFQYEPATELNETTNYGTQKIIGRRLTNKVWVGTGAGDMTITFTLVGIAHTRLDPNADEIGQFRYNQASSLRVESPKVWVPDVVDGNGHVTVRGHYEANPNYNPKMLSDGNHGLVANPNYKDPRGTVDQAKTAIKDQKIKDNAKVKVMLDKFRVFLEPQEDTGAPHPIYVNMGGAYKGRKFIVHSIKSVVTVTNYATLEPMEATVTMALMEIPAVVVTPEAVVAGGAMTGKGQATGTVKLPSQTKSKRTTLHSKSGRR